MFFRGLIHFLNEKKMNKILFLFFIFELNKAIPLEEFVFDDTDLNVVRYDLIRTVKENLITKYYLNLTTCTWFESKRN